MRRLLRNTGLGLAASAATLGFGTAAHAATVINTGTPGTDGQTALYLDQPGEASIETGAGADPFELASFIGLIDNVTTGLGGFSVTYDLGNYRLFDGMGQDFNVYESDNSRGKFGLADILVSADGVNFFNVENSAAAALNLAGDEGPLNAQSARAGNGPNVAAFPTRLSFDVGGAVTALGVTDFRYLRIDGTGSGQIGGNNGFELDGVGIANFRAIVPNAVPEPGTWLMMILGFGMVGATMRSKAKPSRKHLRTAR